VLLLHLTPIPLVPAVLAKKPAGQLHNPSFPAAFAGSIFSITISTAECLQAHFSRHRWHLFLQPKATSSQQPHIHLLTSPTLQAAVLLFQPQYALPG
jgi:hypothetical protein